MSQLNFQIDSLTPQNMLVMRAYTARAAAAKAASEDYDGWLDRIDTLQDMSSEQLTQLHGQLIAMGFLKFEISGRSVGLRYQISTRGKQALERAVTAENSLSVEHDEEHDCELADAA